MKNTSLNYQCTDLLERVPFTNRHGEKNCLALLDKFFFLTFYVIFHTFC